MTSRRGCIGEADGGIFGGEVELVDVASGVFHFDGAEVRNWKNSRDKTEI